MIPANEKYISKLLEWNSENISHVDLYDKLHSNTIKVVSIISFLPVSAARMTPCRKSKLQNTIIRKVTTVTPCFQDMFEAQTSAWNYPTPTVVDGDKELVSHFSTKITQNHNSSTFSFHTSNCLFKIISLYLN